MEEAKKLIKELKGLMGNFDPQSEKRVREISKWFGEHQDEKTQKLFDEFMEDGMAQIGTEIEDIRRQIADEDYRLLPIGVIAEKYFGKSRSWLSQRLNGTKVRGRAYTLNAEQKAIFNRAVREIGQRIGSFQIA